MKKFKIKLNDKNYYIYADSQEQAVKKLRDATLAQQENRTIEKYLMAIDGLESETDYNSIKTRILNDQNLSPKSVRELLNSLEKQAKKRGIRDSSISDYQPKEISHSRLEAIPLQARQELQNSKNKEATLLSIEGNIEDIINAAEPSNREELKQRGSKITNDLRRQFRITDNVDRNKIEQVIKSRQFELRRDGEKIQEYIYKGNSEDKKNAFEELAKVLPANVGLGLSGDVLSVSFRDNTIKDDNISEFKKELAKWQDLYINKKLITSSELSEKAKELRQKYNIKDEKLTSESILEKAKSLGGQAKQNGATGVLGISITSPQRSDEFADWLEKNNIHYNSDGRQYYVEIQDSSIKDSYYTESEKKNKQFVKNAIEEMEGYINNWNFLTAKQKRDIGASREQLKARVAELKQVKDSSIKDAYDYIGNAMVFKSLPKIGEKAQKYGFGYSNSVISKIEKIYNKDGYQFYRVYCMDEEDYKNNHGTQYYYSVAIKDSNIVRDSVIKDEMWGLVKDPKEEKYHYYLVTVLEHSEKWGDDEVSYYVKAENENEAKQKVKSKTSDKIIRVREGNHSEYLNFKRSGQVIDSSIEDGGFQEIGGYWRDLERKNPGISKIYEEFRKTPTFNNWDMKNSMDIIYSENMFNKFKQFYKQKTGKPIKDSAIKDAEELPHISKEKWNKIPKDYKTTDPATGKKQAFAGSLGIAPGGTTLLTEGKHFIIDAENKEKNWTYVMFGTTGEKKVENLTKAEAEHLLKNNKLLGYSGKIYETVRDNTNNTNKILDSDIVVARSLDELISKIKSWDGETTTNYILSPKSSGWYFDYFITMGHKYSYYAYIKKTAHGRHDNPNVDISKQNIDKTVTAKTAQELIDQVVIILK